MTLEIKVQLLLPTQVFKKFFLLNKGLVAVDRSVVLIFFKLNFEFWLRDLEKIKWDSFKNLHLPDQPWADSDSESDIDSDSDTDSDSDSSSSDSELEEDPKYEIDSKFTNKKDTTHLQLIVDKFDCGLFLLRCVAFIPYNYLASINCNYLKLCNVFYNASLKNRSLEVSKQINEAVFIIMSFKNKQIYLSITNASLGCLNSYSSGSLIQSYLKVAYDKANKVNQLKKSKKSWIFSIQTYHLIFEKLNLKKTSNFLWIKYCSKFFLDFLFLFDYSNFYKWFNWFFFSFLISFQKINLKKKKAIKRRLWKKINKTHFVQTTKLTLKIKKIINN